MEVHDSRCFYATTTKKNMFYLLSSITHARHPSASLLERRKDRPGLKGRETLPIGRPNVRDLTIMMMTTTFLIGWGGRLSGE